MATASPQPGSAARAPPSGGGDGGGGESAAVAAAPAQLRNAMVDLGPTLVTGERMSLVDPAVQELGQLLERAAASVQDTLASNDDAELEVEVRFGVAVRRGRGGGGGAHQPAASRSRIDLPLQSEAVLQAGQGFEYSFVPGLDADLFRSLLRRFKELCEEQRLRCTGSFDRTLDLIYEERAKLGAGSGLFPGETKLKRQIRLTRDLQESDAEPRAFLKDALGSVDLYGGRRLPEHGPMYDMRAAVSMETPLENFSPGAGYVVGRRREKARYSYRFSAWRVDLTNVLTSRAIVPAVARLDTEPQFTKPVQSFEVEVELDPQKLMPNLAAKINGEAHKLWELLSDFMFAARDLVGLACRLEPLPPLVPLPESHLTEEEREAYHQEYGKIVEPVVGHYSYRLAAPRGEPLLWPVAEKAAPPKAKMARTSGPAPQPGKPVAGLSPAAFEAAAHLLGPEPRQ